MEWDYNGVTKFNLPGRSEDIHVAIIIVDMHHVVPGNDDTKHHLNVNDCGCLFIYTWT